MIKKLAIKKMMPLYQEEMFDRDSHPEMLDCLDNGDSSENPSTYKLGSLYTGSSGNILVSQHVHHSHRGPSFVNYNLYEFAALVDMVKKNTSSSQRNNDSFNSSDVEDISTLDSIQDLLHDYPLHSPDNARGAIDRKFKCPSPFVFS